MNNILNYEVTNNQQLINIKLPEGKTTAEIVQMAYAEILILEQQNEIVGEILYFNGRCPVPLASYLSCHFKNKFNALAFYDPKSRQYITTNVNGANLEIGYPVEKDLIYDPPN